MSFKNLGFGTPPGPPPGPHPKMDPDGPDINYVPETYHARGRKLKDQLKGLEDVLLELKAESQARRGELDILSAAVGGVESEFETSLTELRHQIEELTVIVQAPATLAVPDPRLEVVTHLDRRLISTQIDLKRQADKLDELVAKVAAFRIPVLPAPQVTEITKVINPPYPSYLIAGLVTLIIALTLGLAYVLV